MVAVYPIRRVGDNWEHLIIKRATVSYNWQCVTGKVENNEEPLDGAHRELFEETGYKTSKMTPYYYTDDFLVDNEKTGKHDAKFLQEVVNNIEIFVYIAIITDPKDPILDPREHTDWKWCSFETAFLMVDWAVEKKGHRIIRDFIMHSKLINN